MAVLQKAKLLYSSHAVLKPVLWALIGAFALLMLLTFGYLSNQDSWNASASSGGRLVHIQQHFKAAWGVEDGLGGGSHQDEPTLKPWEEALYDRRVCSNTCPFARDGVCNDGRSGSGRVLCDVGTDCADCGAWSLKVPASLRTTPLGKPIEHLRERGVEVYIKDTKSDPTFRMPYTDDSKDIDVSKQMHVWGLVEMGLTQMWGRALQEGSPAACLQPGGSRSLVVDVGGNFGWYTLYAATLGCRVMVWEPVPHFRAFLEYGLQVNNLLGIVDLHATVVAPESDKQYEVLVPQQGIWGAAGIGGVNIDTNLGGGLQPEVVVVPGERLDAMVKEDVALMKIDIEGFEPDAFETAVRIFDQHTVRNVVIEYSPGVYEKGERWNDYHVWPDMLLRLHELGFTMLHVNWPSAKGDLLGVEPEKGVAAGGPRSSAPHHAGGSAVRSGGCGSSVPPVPQLSPPQGAAGEVPRELGRLQPGAVRPPPKELPLGVHLQHQCLCHRRSVSFHRGAASRSAFA
eukprot:jgi/Botrbrau1/7234/Bobra.0021s0018.1